MADKITPGEWFLGREEIEPGEHGWDGKVWAAPTPEEIAGAESVRGTAFEFDPEPWEVATFGSEADARLFLASRKMLATLKAVLPVMESAIAAGLDGFSPAATAEIVRDHETCRAIRAAIAEAKGA